MNRVIRISRQFDNNAHSHGNCDKTGHIAWTLYFDCIIITHSDYNVDGFDKTRE